jgi:hypothetical protein
MRMQAVKMSVKRSSHRGQPRLSRSQPMPEIPGADLAAVCLRSSRSSSFSKGGNGRVGRGEGRLGRMWGCCPCLGRKTFPIEVMPFASWSYISSPSWFIKRRDVRGASAMSPGSDFPDVSFRNVRVGPISLWRF